MQSSVEYAHALDKKLSIREWAFESIDDPTITVMNVSENITAGKAHFGALQGNGEVAEVGGVPEEKGEEVGEGLGFPKSVWNKPVTYVEEDYVGTFRIEQRMNLSTNLTTSDPAVTYDDWLPCTCQAGWADLTLHDARYHSAAPNAYLHGPGFFDCTSCLTPYCLPSETLRLK